MSEVRFALRWIVWMNLPGDRPVTTAEQGLGITGDRRDGRAQALVPRFAGTRGHCLEDMQSG